MKRVLLTPVVALALACGLAAEATAQTNPNQLILQRKGAMDLQVKYWSPLLAMVQGKTTYDAATVQRNADYLAVLTTLAWDDFHPSTIGAANTLWTANGRVLATNTDAHGFLANLTAKRGLENNVQTARRSGVT